MTTSPTGINCLRLRWFSQVWHTAVISTREGSSAGASRRHADSYTSLAAETKMALRVIACLFTYGSGDPFGSGSSLDFFAGDYIYVVNPIFLLFQGKIFISLGWDGKRLPASCPADVPGLGSGRNKSMALCDYCWKSWVRRLKEGSFVSGWSGRSCREITRFENGT